MAVQKDSGAAENMSMTARQYVWSALVTAWLGFTPSPCFASEAAIGAAAADVADSNVTAKIIDGIAAAGDTTLEAAAGGATEAATVSATEGTANLRALPPLDEMITSHFGNRRMPGWLSRRGMVMRDHNGLDIRARQGWPVLAYAGGTVTRAGAEGASGIVVELKHDDGLITRYAHLEKTLCRKGERVELGAAVGLVGCTGRTTGAHLHFGVRDAQNKAMDPRPFLREASQLLGPSADMIPEELTPQQCGRAVTRGPDGKPVRLGRVLKDLESYAPPAIPGWNGR